MVAMFVILLVCVVAFEFVIAAEVKALSSCGNRRQVVALTFDKNFIPAYDELLMGELREANITATFFTARAYGSYDEDELCRMASKILDEGHQLEMLSIDTQHLPDMQIQEIDEEIQLSAEWIKKCTEGHKPKYFRPAYGELLPRQAQHISDKFGLVISMWNVQADGGVRDVRNYSSNDLVADIIKAFEEHVGLGNSAVIQMGDFYAGMRPDVVKQVIRYFKGHGYTFVTVDQCYKSCNTPVCKGSGGPYGNAYVA